jgi:hypothetical protein
MADDFVGHDFSAKTFPFQQPVGFPSTSFTAVPWGQAIVNEAWQSQAIGAGNTGTINLDVEVPNDYVSLLRSFTLSATSGSTIGWNTGVVGLAYQQPGGPYKSSITELPETDYLWWNLSPALTNHVRDRFSSTRYYESFDISNLSTSYAQPAGLNNPREIPLWLPPGQASLKTRAMVVYLENDTASNPAANFRFNAVFDLYTQEQAYASGVMSSPRVF